MDVERLFPHTRIGILGGGFMAQVHSRAARAAGAQVRAVATRTAAGGVRAQGVIGAEFAYRSAEELLADDRIDVVHICTPNGSHAELVRAALTAGKHVVCEKPLATSAAEAEQLVQLAAGTGLVAAVPFVYRFHTMIREARARVGSGVTGRLFTIQGAYLQDWLASAADDDWRVDPAFGGPSRAFADIGSHLCDAIEFVTGDAIRRLSSRVRTVHESRVTNKNVGTEDAVTVVFETDAGVIGTLHVSQVAHGRKNALLLEIAGENESLVFNQENPDVLRVGTAGGFLERLRSDDVDSAARPYSRIPAGHAQGYQDAFNAFVADTYRAVNGSTPDGLPTFADGLRAAQLTEAVLRSDAEDRWIDTPVAFSLTTQHAGSR